MTAAENSFALPSSDQYFRQLKQTPTISWPAVGTFLFALLLIGGASGMALTGNMPLWGAMLINGVGLYFVFTIMHEALHRNVSSNLRINEFFGRLSLMLMIPASPLEIARWAHFQHHRFTTGEADPDNWVHHARWWQIPLRWANFDIYYLYIFLREGGEQRKRHARILTMTAGAYLATVGVLTYFGYGWEVLFLWFLASRVGLFLTALVFIFLPHYPADTTYEEDEYQATTIRQGWEWLLTPLFVYQNYHLIHHLYPTTPFYNYMKIWHLKYDELTSHKPAIQTAFGLMPVNHEQRAAVSPDEGSPAYP